MLEIATVQELTKEEQLWMGYRDDPDDRVAYVSLVEYYLPLVAQIVSRMAYRFGRRVAEEELLGAGIIGLHDAIRQFSFDRGVVFNAFACKRIRGAIQDDLRRRDRLTRRQREVYRSICAVISDLCQTHSRLPTTAEIAAAANLSEEMVTQYISLGREPVSLYDETSDGLRVIDSLEDTHFINPRDAADKSILREEFAIAFRKLPKRDQQILHLLCYEELRGREVAAVLGISEGRVSQLYKEIILKLQLRLGVSKSDCM